MVQKLEHRQKATPMLNAYRIRTQNNMFDHPFGGGGGIIHNFHLQFLLNICPAG